MTEGIHLPTRTVRPALPLWFLSLQFLCVLCVLLLLQAVALTMALIFEKKVNLTHVFPTFMPKQWLPAATVGLTTVPSASPPDICTVPEQHTGGNQALLR